jgi:hypothetical protein
MQFLLGIQTADHLPNKDGILTLVASDFHQVSIDVVGYRLRN